MRAGYSAANSRPITVVAASPARFNARLKTADGLLLGHAWLLRTLSFFHRHPIPSFLPYP
jgi:hypothetical protein